MLPTNENREAFPKTEEGFTASLGGMAYHDVNGLMLTPREKSWQ
jgi:hypothetical protein